MGKESDVIFRLMDQPELRLYDTLDGDVTSWQGQDCILEVTMDKAGQILLDKRGKSLFRGFLVTPTAFSPDFHVPLAEDREEEQPPLLRVAWPESRPATNWRRGRSSALLLAGWGYAAFAGWHLTTSPYWALGGGLAVIVVLAMAIWRRRAALLPLEQNRDPVT
jgi:hypothetical protein